MKMGGRREEKDALQTFDRESGNVLRPYQVPANSHGKKPLYLWMKCDELGFKLTPSLEPANQQQDKTQKAWGSGSSGAHLN